MPGKATTDSLKSSARLGPNLLCFSRHSALPALSAARAGGKLILLRAALRGFAPVSVMDTYRPNPRTHQFDQLLDGISCQLLSLLRNTRKRGRDAESSTRPTTIRFLSFTKVRPPGELSPFRNCEGI